MAVETPKFRLVQNIPREVTEMPVIRLWRSLVDKDLYSQTNQLEGYQ